MRLRFRFLEAKVVVVVGAMALFTAMGVFPPWIYTLTESARSYSMSQQKPIGYAFIFTGPKLDPADSGGVHIDITRLVVQWLTLAGLVAGSFTALTYFERRGSP
jgi:hypothetical protein